MQFSNIASYGICMPALVSAAKIPGIQIRQAAETKFSLIAVRSTTPIHLNQFIAHDNHLWIHGATATSCPTDGSVDCSVFTNGTSFTGTYGKPVAIGMNVAVPGGQTLFVASDGSVQYTEPGANIPAGASSDVWSYNVPGSDPSNNFGSLSLADTSRGLLACPPTAAAKTTGPWEIFVGPTGATVPSGSTADCYTFNDLASTTSAVGAYEYA